MLAVTQAAQAPAVDSARTAVSSTSPFATVAAPRRDDDQRVGPGAAGLAMERDPGLPAVRAAHPDQQLPGARTLHVHGSPQADDRSGVFFERPGKLRDVDRAAVDDRSRWCHGRCWWCLVPDAAVRPFGSWQPRQYRRRRCVCWYRAGRPGRSVVGAPALGHADLRGEPRQRRRDGVRRRASWGRRESAGQRAAAWNSGRCGRPAYRCRRLLTQIRISPQRARARRRRDSNRKCAHHNRFRRGRILSPAGCAEDRPRQNLAFSRAVRRSSLVPAATVLFQLKPRWRPAYPRFPAIGGAAVAAGREVHAPGVAAITEFGNWQPTTFALPSVTTQANIHYGFKG